MKKARLIVLFITAHSFLFAQNKTIDSLNLALKNAHHDTTRTGILVSLSDAWYVSNPDTVIPLCNKALQLIDNGLINAGSLEKYYYLKTKGTAFNNIGFIYNSQGKSAKAIVFLNKSIKVQEDLLSGLVSKTKINEINKDIANTLNNIGYMYSNQGEIPAALEFYDKSLKKQQALLPQAISKKDVDEIKKGIANSLNNIGYIYNNQGNVTEALVYYLQSLKLFEEIKDKWELATSLNNVGYIYSQQGDQAKAQEYYIESLKLREEIGDRKGEAESLNNIGLLYKNRGDKDKARLYFEKSLKINEEIKDMDGMALSLTAIGGIYLGENNKVKAKECFEKSLKIYEASEKKQEIAQCLRHLAGVLFSDGDPKALNYCLKSLQLSKELGYPINIREAAELLVAIYEKQNKPKEALEMNELFVQMRDSINNTETRKAAVKQQFKYEYEKKELNLKTEQEKKDLVFEDQNKRQKMIMGCVIAGLLLFVAFSVLVFKRFKITQKQKSIIEEQKSIVDEAFEKLHEKNKEVTDSIRYAKRIQTALITSEKYLDKHLRRLTEKNT